MNMPATRAISAWPGSWPEHAPRSRPPRQAAGSLNKSRPPLIQAHIEHVEHEPLRRKRADRTRTHARPGLIGRARHRRIQIEEELVRKTAQRRRLAKGQPQSDRFLDPDAARFDFLV